jgi:hypothetical protein
MMRPTVVQARVSPDELASLKQVAANHGYPTVSRMIRDLPNFVNQYQHGNFENVQKTDYIT